MERCRMEDDEEVNENNFYAMFPIVDHVLTNKI